MPDKARRRKGKYTPQSKKGKGRASRPARLVPPPVAAPAAEPVASPKRPVPVSSVLASKAKPAVTRYPNVAAELRTIGILAGIMLIVLVVLALVLS